MKPSATPTTVAAERLPLQRSRQQPWYLLAWLMLGLLFTLLAAPAHAVAPQAGSVISARAYADYLPADSVQLHRAYSNQTVAIIEAVEALTVTGDARQRMQPGAAVAVPYLVSNTGNVASQYGFAPVNAAGGACAADNADLLSPRIVWDKNNNGVADDGEPVLGTLTLEPGQSAALLVVGGAPNQATGDACITLRATTALQKITAAASTQLVLGQGANLRVLKTALYSGYLVPGQSSVAYTITATNNGTGPATGAGTDGLLTHLFIAGAGPQKLILLRDPIPEGTRYKAGTLAASFPGAIKLYRFATDPALTYRLGEPDITAAEVAVAMPAGASVVPGQSIEMKLAVDLLPGAGLGASTMVIDQAYALYNDASADLSTRSNAVVLPLALERVGLALAASTPVARPDGSYSVRFTATLHNASNAPVFNAQILHVLEGISGSSQQYGLGTYTAGAAPGASQYTVLPGSIRIAAVTHGDTVAAANPAYTGQANGTAGNLLQPEAKLPAGATLVLEFDVAINFSGRTASPLLTNANASASRLIDAAPELQDLSTNGLDPDPTGQGPQFSAVPTPIAVPPSLGIHKTLVSLTRVDAANYDIRYRISVVNNGATPAPGVRVMDNLGCAFKQAGVTAWRLLAAPVAGQGRLLVNPAFTGDDTPAAPAGASPCQAEVDSATGMPIGTRLALTDGSRALAPGQAEDIDILVRATLVPATTVVVTNTGWVGSFDGNARLLAARSAQVQALLTQPQGVVYDSATRSPLAGAVVTLTRGACRSGGTTGAITPEQLANGSQYQYNADGSVSLTTGAAGEYQFYWQTPPLDSLCEYKLSVTPPLGWRAAQTLLPQAGTYQGCGAVVANAAAPAATEPTTWYQSLLAGTTGASACVPTHNHVPLDSLADGSLVGLEKQANKKVVEFGDFIDYSLTVTNRSGTVLGSLSVQDLLPPGFAYVAGTARADGKPLPAEPLGAPGPQLSFSLPALSLANGAKTVITYRVRVGVGAVTQGDAVNRATAVLGNFRSAEASWRVRITGGVFADDAYVVGKVFLDCNRNGLQEPAEPGVPGVRLFMENGVSVVTDGFGRWSLYGLAPVTHVMKIDTSSLPEGAAPQIWDNRNAQVASSRFVDLKKGELGKADWPLSGCDDPATQKEVEARRKAAQAGASASADRAVPLRLEASGTSTQATDITADRRGSPAAGGNLYGGPAEQLQATSQATALIKLPTLNTNTTAATASTTAISPANTGNLNPAPSQTPLPVTPETDSSFYLGPLVSAGTVELEDLVSSLDAKPAFLDFQDGDVLASAVTYVRVKGPAGTQLLLSVNGKPVDGRRVGKKTTQTQTGVAAWEYVGVELQPGPNQLVLTVQDDMGITRGESRVTVKAPGGIAKLQLQWPTTARADPLDTVSFKLRLADANGLPVTARTAVTLEIDRGQWLTPDLNPAEPGLQIFVSGGEATVQVRPPIDPGPVTLRAKTGTIATQLNARYAPAQRPLIGVGIVEGVVDLTQRGKLTLGAPSAASAFEQELRSVGNQTEDARSAGRLAFFFKGTVKGEYLLTAAYDSDKRYRDRLFRDIKPDEYYPVYGDDSTRAFDAQSTQRLYVRVDKDRSYLLLGDFSTASSAEVRQLTQVNRNLSGVKHQYETEDLRITSFVSEDTTRQQIEELRANGLSFYFLGGTGDLVPNSERVELLVRSAGQPQIVLSTRQLSRGTDYSFDVLTRKLVLAQPLASFDPNLNPQSLRVAYEVDVGGPKFVVAGMDAQVKLNPQLQVGSVGVKDTDPANQRSLVGLTAIARLDDNSTLAAEAALTESDLKGRGRAARVELKHADPAFRGQVQAARIGSNFDNPSALGSAGRTEVTGTAEYLFNPQTRVRAELQYSAENTPAAGQTAQPDRENVTVAVQHKINDLLTAEAGLRYGNTASTTAGSFTYGQTTGATPGAGTGSVVPATTGASTGATTTTSARARITSRVPKTPQAEVFAEAEQDLERNSNHAIGLGGTYALTDQTRVYGRYSLLDTLNANAAGGVGAQRVTSVLGIDSNFGSGTRLYNEARWGEANTQNATGLRHTLKLSEAWRLTGGLEHTRVIAGATTPANTGTGTGTGTGATPAAATATDSTAVTLGADYLQGNLRGSAAAEWRSATGTETALLALGAAYRFNDDWTGLARTTTTRTTGANASATQLLSRQQLGLAWRPADIATFNALLRFENRYERGVATPGLNTNAATTTGPGLATHTQILSALGNYSLSRGSVLTGRWAGKWANVSDATSHSSYWAQLLHTRYTRDLNADWDVGLQAGVMLGQGGAQQRTAGIELGYQLMPNLWLSGGYNVLGLKDPDLTGGDYTSRGVYLRLRYKFDESAFGAPPAARRKPAPVDLPPEPAAPPAPAQPQPVPPQPAPEPAPLPPAAQPQPAPAQVVVLSAQALFATNQAQLSAAGKHKLGELAQQLKGLGVELILVVGHTDATGTEAYNQALSERRANAVRQYLVAQGLSAERIQAQGRGEREPVASNATAAGRAKNRRVEIRVNQPAPAPAPAPAPVPAAAAPAPTPAPKAAPAAATGPASGSAWRPGAALPPGPVPLDAAQLFAAGQTAELNGNGQALLQALADRLKDGGATAVTLSAGHGEAPDQLSNQWLQRAAAVRSVLVAAGLQVSDLSVDTQPLDPQAAAPAGSTTRHVAIRAAGTAAPSQAQTPRL